VELPAEPLAEPEAAYLKPSQLSSKRPAEPAAAAPASGDRDSREMTRLVDWCRALETRIESLSREKEALIEEIGRLRARNTELIGIIKGIEQAFIIGRTRRGQPLPGQVPEGPPVVSQAEAWSEQDPTRFQERPPNL
jgi:hypothetical protein